MNIKLFLILSLVSFVKVSAQTLYVPSGTSGVGNNTTNSNVGIGTSSAPPEKLTVSGTISLYGSGLDGSNLQRTVIYSDVTNGLYFDAPKNSSGSKQDIQFNWRGGGTTPFIIRGASSFIGMGTNNPLSRLDINGNATGTSIMNSSSKIVEADSQDMISIQSLAKASVLNLVSERTTAGSLGGLLFTTTNGYSDSHRNIAGIVGGRTGTDAVAGGYLSFWTKNGGGDIPRENMRLTHEGRMGIGTTNPLSRLDINGNATGTQIMNSTGKIIDADNVDMISVQSLNKASVLNLVSERTTAGSLGGLLFTTTNGYSDSHRNIAGIVGGRTGTDAVAGGYLSFWTKNGGGDIPRENVRITHEGRVGIGTTSPDRNLHVDGGTGGSSMMLGSITTLNRTSLWLSTEGETGKASIQSWWHGVNQGSLSINPSGGDVIISPASGNVGIGTANPDSKLTVKGDVHTKEVRVDLAGAVAPDYVFEEDYKLTSLSDLEIYLKLNKHLPEVPSAKQMEEDGMKLKEMNLLLLKKVEELTLYVIEQQNTIKEQNDRITRLESKVDR